MPDDLRELVDLITKPNHLDQASLNHIVKNLYPAAAVDSDIIVNIVGGLGHGVLKPSLAIQVALLKWIIMVYPVLDKQSVLSQCYSVLFHLLDTAALRYAPEAPATPSPMRTTVDLEKARNYATCWL